MKSYDVIIICFTDPNLDARTINLTKTLIKYGRKVGLITPDYGKSISYLGEEDYFPCKIDINQRVRKSQREFTKQVKKLRLSTQYVHAGDFYSLPAAKRIKAKQGAKLIYDSREIYSQLNSLANRIFARKFIEFKEKFLITYVDRVLVTAEEDELYLKKHFMHSIPYSIIKNLPPKVELQESNKLRKTLGIAQDKLLLLYQGWVLEGRGLNTLIETMPHIDSATLVIIGDGNYLQKLKAKATELNLDSKVYFTGFVDYDVLLTYTMSADVGVVLFENSSISYQNALPNKLFEFIQCGLPVIATNQKTISKIVESESLGISLSSLNKEALTNAINELSDSNKRETYKENVLKVRDKYSYETQEVEILKIFN
jgi:glycosyltransferase involved in cell wall biosynthesis